VNNDHASPFSERRGLSLELKLPLVVSALLGAMLLLYLWVAYTNVGTSTAALASEGAARMAFDLGRITATGTSQRAAAFFRVANRPEVKTALRGGNWAPAESTLARLEVRSDSGLTVVVLDSLQRAIRFVGKVAPVEMTRRISTAVALASVRPDTLAAVAPMFAYQNRAHTWTAAEVRDNGSTLGYIAQLRKIGSSGSAVRSLIGDERAILFANRGSQARDGWTTIEGNIVPAPARRGTRFGAPAYERAGEWYIGHSDTVPGTPYSIIVETPLAQMHGRALQFLFRTGLFSLALLVLGTLFGWLLSRRYTGPIRELNRATAAIAAKAYDRRARVNRTDELGALARAFNHMASEIQKNVREAEISKAEAERANRTKSEFLANMSHEIRTPINAILGYTNLMEMGLAGALSEQQRTQLRRVRLSGQHLLALIDDLLDFTRLENAHLTLEVRVVSARESVQTALTVTDPAATDKGVELSAEVKPETFYVGDPKRVEQILVNLIGNAIKFTASGGRVRVESRTTNGTGQGLRTEFVVEDTGIGIPDDRVENIFEPFVQVHTGYTRQHGGSGLGLTISRRLAVLMGGHISVQSQEGVGSRFTLTLPAPADFPAHAGSVDHGVTGERTLRDTDALSPRTLTRE
jgi:signal transduction histidine kinase